MSYNKVSGYFRNRLGIEADESCKDISRLCFLSYDPQAHYNPTSQTFEVIDPELQKIWNKVVNKTQNTEGNRNNLVFMFGVLCENQNINEQECFEFTKLMTTLPPEEVKRTIKSSYSGDYKNVNHAIPKSKYEIIENCLSGIGDIRFNIVKNKPEVTYDGTNYEEIDDLTFNNLLRQISAQSVKVSIPDLKTVLYSDFAKRFNPFENYFKNLPEWDGYDYIDELMSNVPFKDRKLAYFYFRKWIIGLVACLLEEDEVNQHLLVIVGGQGIGKTTWLGSLMPKELRQYKFHGVVNPDNKDTLVMLSDKALIIIDELDSMSNKHLGLMKDIITKPFIVVRRPYGHTADNLPRRASFAASVNNHDFLVDTTGNRRYLCLEVIGEIPRVKSFNLTQFFAQAFALYKSGERYWFNQGEIIEIDRMNEMFLPIYDRRGIIIEVFSTTSG